MPYRLIFIYDLIVVRSFFFFFFNDTATTEIYTLSLHDALPICLHPLCELVLLRFAGPAVAKCNDAEQDRKSTRLNSSHVEISYAVFCLKKKKDNTHSTSTTA